MHEEAAEIHKYFPIRKNPVEEEYIKHLWYAFLTLDSAGEFVQPFTMMPFHLLFMLALQYKALRIAKEMGRDYATAFTIRNIRDIEMLRQPTSVFDFSLLQERTLPDLFRLVNLDEKLISKIKKLVSYRNENLAHANGGIAREFNLKIIEYLECLRLIQKKFISLNDNLADIYKGKITAEDDKNEFIETRLFDSLLCPGDFEEGSLNGVFGLVGSYV